MSEERPGEAETRRTIFGEAGDATPSDLREARGSPPELAVLAEAVLERNAGEPVLLDLRGISDATDFFLVATGDSDVHTKAIAENVRRHMEDAGYSPGGVEGENKGRWILLDYFNVVVHIFLPRVRDFYQLERLWGDAPRVAVRD